MLWVVAALALAAGFASALVLVPRRRPEPEALWRLAVQAFPSGALLLFDRRLRHVLVAGQGSFRQVTGKTVRDAFPKEVWTVLEPAYRAALEGEESVFELPYGDRDHLHRVVPVRDRSGAIVAGMVVAQDITDRKTREHHLRQWASRDGLTGLWNRGRFVQELDRFLDEGRRRNDRAGCLLFIDLDGFKAVNDRLGHGAGDELLRRVSRELEAGVRHTDSVARLGGDEFAVLLPGATALQAERVGAKIAGAVESVWPAGCRGGASVGVAVLERGSGTAVDVLSAADRAMYAVKRGGSLRRAS